MPTLRKIVSESGVNIIGYSKDTIIQASSAFREELEANLDDTAIDNDYLGRRWVTLLDMFDDKN